MKRIRVFAVETHDVVYEVDVADDYDITTSEEDYPWSDTDKVDDSILDVSVTHTEVLP